MRTDALQRKDAALTRHSIDRVSLSFGNWIGLIGLVAMMLLGIGSAYVGLIEQIGDIENNITGHEYRIRYLEGVRP